MLKRLLNFIPASWKIRQEVKATGEGQLALGDDSLLFFVQRLGWSPQAARYLATAFTFGVRENIAAVLEKAQLLSDSEDFEEQFVKRVLEDPSIIGPALDASKFTSSEELRDLLGRILAGEVDKPGSVSRKAVSVAQDLTPRNLQEFLKLRAVAWRNDPRSENDGCIVVLGKRLGLYDTEFISFDSDEIGVNYYDFGELQQLGLLQERAYGIGFGFSNELNELDLGYGERIISLRATAEQSKVSLGMYALTGAGENILTLFIGEEFVPLEGYFEEVCEYWRSTGLEVVEVVE